jgi:indole-3-glycerol phosphate synthase
MTNILQEIYQYKLIEVRNHKKQISVQQICDKIDCDRQILDFIAALTAKNVANQNALICEVKKASPSKGVIRKDFDPVKIAKIYQESGAACVSVLTDEKYFQGHSDHLAQIRQNIDLPILRKDFIVDEYQIYEAKMIGADCILLIVAMLDDEKLLQLEDVALKAGLSVLIEVHDEEEFNRALKMQSKLIGVNNRNLKTLEVDINNSINLAKNAPEDYILVGESGVKSPADLVKLNEAGIQSFLIGEHFMLQDDISSEVGRFIPQGGAALMRRK